MKVLASLLFFSLTFWVGSTSNPVGWSFVEVLCGVCFLQFLLKKETIHFPSFRVSFLFLCLGLWAAASFLWSQNFHSTLTALYKIIFCGILTVLFINDRPEWESAMDKSLWIVGSLGALCWIGAQFAPNLSPFYPNLHAGFLSLCGVYFVARYLEDDFTQGKIAGLISILIGAAVFFSGSLGPALAWLAGVMGLFAWHFAEPKKNQQKKLRILGVSLVALFLLIFTPFLNTPVSVLFQKIGNFPDPRNPFKHLWERRLTDPYAFERLLIWKDSIRMFLKHPIRGAGLGSYREVYPEFKSISGIRNAPYAHNEALHLLSEMGLIGFLLAVLLLAAIFRENRILVREASLRPWIAVGFSAGVQSLFDFNLRYEPTTILCVFALSQLIQPKDFTNPSKKTRKGLIVLSMGSTLLMSLPGMAYFLFLANPYENAHIAKKIDPLNGQYWSQTGRMRDLEIAIFLEPRNVWYRRQAAQFFMTDWLRIGNENSLRRFDEEYQAIFRLAPNVDTFQNEYREALLKIQGTKSALKRGGNRR